MGSGKTHWGRLLSNKLQIPFFDLDEQIVASEEKSIVEIFEDKGEEYFRMLEKDTLHIITESHDSFIMATGGGTPCYFTNLDYMNRSGTTVWLNTPIDVLFERLVKEKTNRPLLKNLNDNQVRAFIIKKFSDRKIFYEQASIIVDEDTETMEKMVGHIFHA